MIGDVLEAVAVISRILFSAAKVVPENLFIEVTEKMERFDANVGSLKPTLQERPEIFQSVCVNLPVHVPLRMVNHVVRVVADKSFVGLQPVAQESGHGSDVFSDFAVNQRLAPIINHLYSDFSAALQESHYGDFIVWPTAANDATAMHVRMHVPRFAADESFVHFDFPPVAAEFHGGFGLHGEADSVEHEPCGFLSDAECAGHFIRANAVFAVGNHPHCDKPLIEWERGIFHNGSDFCGELPLRMLALAFPDAAGGKETDFLTPACRTFDIVRPAARNHEVNAVIGIGEVNDGLL